MQFRYFWVVAALLSFFAAQGGAAETFDIEQATNAYLSVISAEEEANTNGYVDAGYQIMVMAVLYEVVVAFLLLQFGFARRWRELAERIVKWRFLQAFIFAPIYLLVTSILSLPLAWYSGHYVEHKFGLSNMDLAQWFSEHIMQLGFTIIGFTVFIALFYIILRRSRQNWWMWSSGLVIAFFAFMMFVGPLYVDPAFNEYRPMDEGPLKERILSIARANGMEADDVKQVDASKQNKRVSANVAGLFGTSRIALNDNLLNRASPDGVEAVMAHEIGHYVLNHQWKMMAIFAVIFFVGFAIAGVLFRGIVRLFGRRWGIRDIDDYAGFPLLYAIGAVLIFFITPLQYRVIYVQEAEADLFAINATQNPDAWAEVALLTAEYRKLRPPQWEEDWLNHHPSPYARIHMAMVWKAENLPDKEVSSQPSGTPPEEALPAEQDAAPEDS